MLLRRFLRLSKKARTLFSYIFFPKSFLPPLQKKPRYFPPFPFSFIDMSSSRSLHNLRVEEDDFDRLPLKKSVQNPKGKKSSSSSNPKLPQGLSSPRKSRKKTLVTVYDPSKVFSSQIAALLLPPSF